MIEMLEQQVLARLGEAPEASTRINVAAEHLSGRVEVHARRFKNGKAVLGYALEGIRLERHNLLQLLCIDTDCPQCLSTQGKWHVYRGVIKPTSRVRQRGIQFRHLVEEVEIEACGMRCVARPAAFVCLRSCPAKVHTAAQVKKAGWDLFDRNQYLGGGLITNLVSRELEPLLPTLAAARAWFEGQASAQAA